MICYALALGWDWILNPRRWLWPISVVSDLIIMARTVSNVLGFRMTQSDATHDDGFQHQQQRRPPFPVGVSFETTYTIIRKKGELWHIYGV